VLFRESGVVTGAGRHDELLHTNPAYRAVVRRGED
jgi:ABC-type multidrug transport system fused ATPase/permease subunit